MTPPSIGCGTCRLCFGTKPAYQPPTRKPTMSETAFATALDSLGEDPGRDAIHLATYAVVAGERLFPGQHIGVRDGDVLQAFSTAEKLLGIVDPFLKATVFPGQMFWMMLYPRSITSLRHVWTHPDFGAEPKDGMAPRATMGEAVSKQAAEAWLRKWTDENDCPSYDTVMAAIARRPLPENEDGDYSFSWQDYGDGPALFFSGLDAHATIPDEFWDKVEIVTGQRWAREQRGKYFTCSC